MIQYIVYIPKTELTFLCPSGQWNVTPLPAGEESHLLETEADVSLAPFEEFNMDIKDSVQLDPTLSEKLIENNLNLNEGSSTSHLEGLDPSESEPVSNAVHVSAKVRFYSMIDFFFNSLKWIRLV